MPTASSVSPIVPALINRVSQHSANRQPPAIARPLIAATVGLGWVNTARNARASAARNSAT